MYRNIFIISSWTIISRITGFIREILFARIFGTSDLAEVFFIAMRLPNVFRGIFADGAFSSAFLPMFSRKVVADEDAQAFLKDTFSVLFFGILTLNFLLIIFMPQIIWLVAGGIDDAAKLEMTVSLSRITISYVFFVAIAAMLSAVLNALGEFALTTAAPIVLNLMLICFLSIPISFGFFELKVFSFLVPLAGAIHLGLVWLGVCKKGFQITGSRPRISPDIKKLLFILGPTALVGSATQLNLIVGQRIASVFDGAIAWLNYADRLFQLPLGIIGVAIGAALLPELSRLIKLQNYQKCRETFNKAIRVSLLLALPASVGLYILAVPLIALLFEYGNFLNSDTLHTASVLKVYALGLPAFILQKVYIVAFFAHQRTKAPLVAVVLSIVFNFLTAYILLSYFGFIAAAIGQTISGWVGLGLLIYFNKNYLQFSKIELDTLKETLKCGLATVFMACVLFLPKVMDFQVSYKLMTVLTVLFAIIVYFGTMYLLRSITLAKSK